MKAAVCARYGPQEVVHIGEVGQPVPNDNEVLIRIHATTVNRTDCLPILTPIVGNRRLRFPIPKDSKDDVAFVRGLIGPGHDTPVLDRRYPLKDIAEATTYVGAGQKTGNVVLPIR